MKILEVNSKHPLSLATVYAAIKDACQTDDDTSVVGSFVIVVGPNRLEVHDLEAAERNRLAKIEAAERQALAKLAGADVV
jgi:hypothetical protein